jgi:hypothetical protein
VERLEKRSFFGRAEGSIVLLFGQLERIALLSLKRCREMELLSDFISSNLGIYSPVSIIRKE